MAGVLRVSGDGFGLLLLRHVLGADRFVRRDTMAIPDSWLPSRDSNPD